MTLNNLPGTFLELFCGSANVSRAFRKCNFSTFSTDIRKRKGICEPDLKIDIRNLSSSLIPFKKINVIWASIPCTAFSFCAGNHYYEKGHYNIKALEFIEIAQYTLDFIEKSNPDFYFIENPRGRLRTLPAMKEFLTRTHGISKTITLSSYGHSTTKPTNIFTNAIDWHPKTLAPYGRGNKNPNNKSFSNLTLHKRQSTPFNLGLEIAQYCKHKFEFPETILHNNQLQLF